ncbi:hypothetical protein VS84_03638 [Vibrio cholerae]|nr:hypothetical protein VS84_03638 [Vibrio cholerae]KKP18963.1 hypothetical protein VS86_03548 [Vibrio cholerae]
MLHRIRQNCVGNKAQICAPNSDILSFRFELITELMKIDLLVTKL